MRKAILLVVAAVFLQAAAPSLAEARVVRFVVEQTRTFAEGKRFGDVGPYVRLDGTAVLEVDPSDLPRLASRPGLAREEIDDGGPR